jgi:hypothetical protein
MLFDGGSAGGRFHIPPNVRNIRLLARYRTTFLECRSGVLRGQSYIYIRFGREYRS